MEVNDLDLHDIVFADYLESIARGGPSVMTWDEVSLEFPAFFKEFFNRAARHYNRFTSFKVDLEQDSEVRLIFRFILDKVETFNDFPFTWKRICEIIIEPRRYYDKMISLMRGLQRVINVETTIALHPESVLKRNAAELELSRHMESIFFKVILRGIVAWITTLFEKLANESRITVPLSGICGTKTCSKKESTV
ncbi:unnamed protein product [Heligmosomoides polygyrus]|uniref:SPK domain-containing protein n=1 Tax=Heligmosomoides polygyrus TaxID=6339 RepID=A0A183GNR0_HELPZ|nr:unnamed protein product [Heligmosomoides polygyrus]